MKKFAKYTMMGALAACMAVAPTSCTDLDETLYDQLNDTNIDLTDENDVSLLLGAAVAQYRYLVEDWFGMFHLLEEGTDQYMVPKRIAVGWGDTYINIHQHNWSTELDQSYNPWSLAYQGIAYANLVLDNAPEDATEPFAKRASSAP